MILKEVNILGRFRNCRFFLRPYVSELVFVLGGGLGVEGLGLIARVIGLLDEEVESYRLNGGGW